MRPKSKLLFKRRLMLPTIKEGDTEETVRDWKENNTLSMTGHSVSSDDYLLSICHLAHPTFPIRDVSPDNVCTCLQLTQHGGKRPSSFRVSRSEENLSSRCLGNSDPLEYLYGHQSHLSVLCSSQPGAMRRAFSRQNGPVWEARTRAHSIPAASPTDLPWQSKSSCSQLDAIADASPLSSGEEERQNPTIKPSLISRWISDCRSAWGDARARACMLPSIAEVQTVQKRHPPLL
ncbi:protein DEPP1 [Thalassophryne amazonica]|uniref:protein DEPP1 n=1 Tax=Thalassophryne amazonica TaxID=390379 RepID=UPI00147092D3|nr:protein DEPP1 [Thalassophryne amazonica]